VVGAEGREGREGGEEVREAAEGADEGVVGGVVGGVGDVVAAWREKRVRYGSWGRAKGNRSVLGSCRGSWVAMK